VNCTKFGLLIFRKIIQTVATRCHILRLKCNKLAAALFHITLGKLTALPQTFYLDYKSPTFKRREKEKREGEKKTKAREKKTKKKRKGRE